VTAYPPQEWGDLYGVTRKCVHDWLRAGLPSFQTEDRRRWIPAVEGRRWIAANTYTEKRRRR